MEKETRMLTEDEAVSLHSTRESFYSKDWRYGELFDSNLVDCLTNLAMSFKECVAVAAEDTDTYIFIEESIPDNDYTTAAASGYTGIRH